jgi:hypothetical protein
LLVLLASLLLWHQQQTWPGLHQLRLRRQRMCTQQRCCHHRCSSSSLLLQLSLRKAKAQMMRWLWQLPWCCRLQPASWLKEAAAFQSQPQTHLQQQLLPWLVLSLRRKQSRQKLSSRAALLQRQQQQQQQQPQLRRQQQQ